MPVRRLLLGRRTMLSVLGLLGAVLVAVLFDLPFVFDRGVPNEVYFAAVGLVGCAAAAAHAYANDGLPVCWVLGGAPLAPFAFTLAFTRAPVGANPTLLGGVLTFLGSAGLLGVVLGTLGFLFGVGGRHLRYRRRSVTT